MAAASPDAVVLAMKVLPGILCIAIAVLVLAILEWQWVAACGVSWSELAHIGIWIRLVAGALLIMLPLILWNKRWLTVALLLICYVVMLANLLYLRTFGNWIPIGSYVLASNVPKFFDSVIDSFRVGDTIGLLLIAVFVFCVRRYNGGIGKRGYIASVVVTGILAIMIIRHDFIAEGMSSYSVNHRRHAVAAVRYSLPVVLINDIMDYPRLDDNGRETAREALNRRIDTKQAVRLQNLVVIFMESLESWPIGLSINGREITPTMNRLVGEDKTLSCMTMHQMTGIGRSIDAQLLVVCGLVPSRNRVFSFAYPGNDYPSVYHAMKEVYGSRVSSFTTDRPEIYNIGVISSRFGVDSLYVMTDPQSGHRLDDEVFFRSVRDKIESDSLWRDGGSNVMQLVTYSCHAPFRHCGKASFPLPEEWPSALRRYIEVVNYTDNALGEFIEYLECKNDYGNTLVVITGDHPAFGIRRRAELAVYLPQCSEEYIPMIMLNADSHADLKKKDVFQCDVYTTMIELLGLGSYNWHGVGTSVIAPDRTEMDVDKVSELILNYNLYNPDGR